MFNFLKKRKSNKKTDITIKSSINDIWKMDDRNEFLIAMYTRVSQKCNYGDNMDPLTMQERIFFIVQQLEVEVNNGGFSQYFYNSSGDFVNEVVDSFMAIGAENTAIICKKAIRAFGCDIPLPRDQRIAFLGEKSTKEVSELFDECDCAFFKYPDHLEALNYNFIIKNKEYFN